MAGWQLVKCTSTYFVSPFWRGAGGSFIDTIKKMYLRRIGSFYRTRGRQIPSYLSKAAVFIYYLLMHVAFFFAIVCEVFEFREVF